MRNVVASVCDEKPHEYSSPLVALQHGFGDERQIPSCAGTGDVQLIACLGVDVPKTASFPGLHVAGVQHNAHVLIAVHALGRAPVLGEAVVLLMPFVKQLDRLGVSVESLNRCRVVLKSHGAGPFVVGLDVDADLLRDEVADALTAAAAALEAFCIDL